VKNTAYRNFAASTSIKSNFVNNPPPFNRYNVLKLQQSSRYSDSATVRRIPGSTPCSSKRIVHTALEPHHESYSIRNRSSFPQVKRPRSEANDNIFFKFHFLSIYIWFFSCLIMPFMYFYCYDYVFSLYVYVRLPLLRFFRAFSSVIRQMPG
jgi:hypothetical protein